MNYRELLKKYMRLVLEAEGVTFLDTALPFEQREAEINETEFAELKAIAEELNP